MHEEHEQGIIKQLNPRIAFPLQPDSTPVMQSVKTDAERGVNSRKAVQGIPNLHNPAYGL